MNQALLSDHHATISSTLSALQVDVQCQGCSYRDVTVTNSSDYAERQLQLEFGSSSEATSTSATVVIRTYSDSETDGRFVN